MVKLLSLRTRNVSPYSWHQTHYQALVSTNVHMNITRAWHSIRGYSSLFLGALVIGGGCTQPLALSAAPHA